jgi:2-methylaconitate cis-trans-isomerase PrpF
MTHIYRSMNLQRTLRRSTSHHLSNSRWFSHARPDQIPRTLAEVPNPIPGAGFYRGGTSKGVFIHSQHLPESTELWPKIFMGVMGSPDPIHKRQLNGMGGGISSLSKAVVVSPSLRKDIDCEYTFIQVGVGEEGLDFSGNCGNLSSIAGIFAVDAGICQPHKEMDGTRGRVRSWNTNTNKRIDTVFPLDSDGRPKLDLDEVELAGVSGKASSIAMEFIDPAGAMTGKLLPTGNAVDVLQLPGEDLAEVSLVDATNPTVILPHHELRILLSLRPDDPLDFSSKEALDALELVRTTSAKLMGLPPAPAQPKIVVIRPPQKGSTSEEDLAVRALSMGVPHKAIPMTVGLCLGVAAQIKNTVVERMLRKSSKLSADRNNVVLRHPSGIVQVGAVWDGNNVQAASVIRTGRRLMRGDVFW